MEWTQYRQRFFYKYTIRKHIKEKVERIIIVLLFISQHYNYQLHVAQGIHGCVGHWDWEVILLL